MTRLQMDNQTAVLGDGGRYPIKILIYRYCTMRLALVIISSIGFMVGCKDNATMRKVRSVERSVHDVDNYSQEIHDAAQP